MELEIACPITEIASDNAHFENDSNCNLIDEVMQHVKGLHESVLTGI